MSLTDFGIGANVSPPAAFTTGTDDAERGYRFAYLSAAKQTPLMSLDELLDAAEAAVTKRTDWFYAVGEDDAAMRGTSQALAFVVYAVTVRDVKRVDLLQWVDEVESWAASSIPEDGSIVPPPRPWRA